MRVWDGRNGAELLCLCGHEGSVWSVSFSPDGSQIASGSMDSTVRVWEARTGACLRVIRVPKDETEVDVKEPAYPWRAAAQWPETVIKAVATRQPLAWFPEAVSDLATHPSGRTWAGGVGDYLCLFTLEGGAAATGGPGQV
jgi:WD40 repeat protein